MLRSGYLLAEKIPGVLLAPARATRKAISEIQENIRQHPDFSIQSFYVIFAETFTT
jgi:hypothetical protein